MPTRVHLTNHDLLSPLAMHEPDLYDSEDKNLEDLYDDDNVDVDADGDADGDGDMDDEQGDPR